MMPERKYYIIVEGERHEGPFSFEELVAHRSFSPSANVWREGMADWAQAGMIVDFADYFADLSQTEEDNEPPVEETPRYTSEAFISQSSPAPSANTSTPSMPSWWNEKKDSMPEMPSTYLAFAIIMTICCCIPTGIVAIIYSSKVSSAYYRGDYDKSKSYSEMALLWSLVSLVLGLLCMPLSIIFQSMAALA